jgi:hypothetical protein
MIHSFGLEVEPGIQSFRELEYSHDSNTEWHLAARLMGFYVGLVPIFM